MTDHHKQDELAGRTAVVTGASSGIGRAIALELAAAGASVVVHARTNGGAAEAVCHEIRAKYGEDRATVMLYDLRESENREALVRAAWEWCEGIDIWVNNAGADILTGEAGHWGFDQKLDALWQVDVLATVHLSRLVGERMK